MTTMGRPRIPAAIKRARGEPEHHIHPEPQYKLGLPQAPAWLDERARGYWQEMGTMLQSQGVVSVVDTAAFCVLCDLWSEYRMAREALAKSGAVTPGQAGVPRVAAEYMVLSKARQDFVRVLRDFGMTPASRSSVGKSEKTAADPFEEYLDGSGSTVTIPPVGPDAPSA
jgi:P27 family predicted phage terminase small subunit